jgi:hypothetical protein
MYLSHLIRWGMLAIFQSPNGYLFDATAVVEPPASSSGTSSTTGTASPAPSSAVPDPNAPPPAGGTRSTSTGTTGQPGTSTTITDEIFNAELKRRSAARGFTVPGWVPGHRLVEETTTRTKLQKDLDLANQRLRLAMGIDPANQPNPEADGVKKAFLDLWGGPRGLIKELFGVDLDPAALARALQNGSAAGDVVQQHWDNHRTAVLADVTAGVVDALNVEKLSARQAARVEAAFQAYVREGVAADNAGFTQRYEARDPQMVADFVKEFTEDFVEPVRRTSSQQFTPPRVPRPGGSRPVVTKPVENNAKSVEEAEDVGVKYMRERGHFRGPEND